jgi:hypothetical protein
MPPEPRSRISTLTGATGRAAHPRDHRRAARDARVLVIRDITERLAIEAREAELRTGLIRLQRQQAIAQLTAGIAHDFNNCSRPSTARPR